MHSFFERFKALDLIYKAYLSALAILLIAAFSTQVFPALKSVHDLLLLLSSLGFAIGFCMWCWPFALKVWEHPAGKVAIAIAHVFVLLLATAFSRNVVASAIGLPPQDFDITVSFLVLLFYIPASSLVVAIGVALIALSLELLALTRHQFIEIAKTLAHMVGAFVACFLFTALASFVMENEKLLHPVVKWVAFFGDFQPASSYPGISPNDRVRLHENGVISSARIDKNEVLITIRKYEQ